MKIRLKMAIGGAFHGVESPQRGQVVEVDDENGARYCELGYAEKVDDEPVVEVSTPAVETATLDEESEASAPVEERRPRTPRSQKR